MKISPAGSFGALIEILFRFSETFSEPYSSIGVQLSRAVQGQNWKAPRWQPRGCDTQSFRPLVQEEVVSSGARVLVHRLRVNSIWPAPASYS
jgi:hypothetical protein